MTTPANNALVIVRSVTYQRDPKSALSVKKATFPLTPDVKFVVEEVVKYVLYLIHQAVLNVKKDFIWMPIKSVKSVLSNVAHVRTIRNA